MVKNLDKYRGCLIVGAAGDALGYAVEFFDTASIFKKYGEQGISQYSLVNRIVEISDDTQRTLLTANMVHIDIMYGQGNIYTNTIRSKVTIL